MNKRKHAKSFPLAATVIIIAVAVCTVTFLVKALMVKYQVIQGGNKLKLIERQLGEVNIKNEALQTRKDILTSPPKLQDAIDSGVLATMIEIADKHVVNARVPLNLEKGPKVSVVGEEER